MWRFVCLNVTVTILQVQQAQTRGVLLLAGFSAGLLKSFFAGRLEEFTPAAQVHPKPCANTDVTRFSWYKWGQDTS